MLGVEVEVLDEKDRNRGVQEVPVGDGQVGVTGGGGLGSDRTSSHPTTRLQGGRSRSDALMGTSPPIRWLRCT